MCRIFLLSVYRIQHGTIKKFTWLASALSVKQSFCLPSYTTYLQMAKNVLIVLMEKWIYEKRWRNSNSPLGSFRLFDWLIPIKDLQRMWLRCLKDFLARLITTTWNFRLDPQSHRRKQFREDFMSLNTMKWSATMQAGLIRQLINLNLLPRSTH